MSEFQYTSIKFFENVWYLVFTFIEFLLLQNMVSTKGDVEIFSPNSSFNKMLTKICSTYAIQYICFISYYGLFGFSPIESNKTLITKAVEQAVGGGSVKQSIHLLQGVNSGKCIHSFNNMAYVHLMACL